MKTPHVTSGPLALLLLAGSVALVAAQSGGSGSAGASPGGTTGGTATTTGPTAPGPSGPVPNTGTLGGTPIAPGPAGSSISTERTGPGGTKMAPGSAGSLNPSGGTTGAAGDSRCDPANTSSLLGPQPSIMTESRRTSEGLANQSQPPAGTTGSASGQQPPGC